MKRGPETGIEYLPEQVIPKKEATITYEKFIDACKNGTLEEVEQGIISLSPDTIAKYNNAALLSAAEQGHLDVVRQLYNINAVRQVAANNNLFLSPLFGFKGMFYNYDQIDAAIENLAVMYPNLARSLETENSEKLATAKLVEVSSTPTENPSIVNAKITPELSQRPAREEDITREEGISRATPVVPLPQTVLTPSAPFIFRPATAHGRRGTVVSARPHQHQSSTSFPSALILERQKKDKVENNEQKNNEASSKSRKPNP